MTAPAVPASEAAASSPRASDAAAPEPPASEATPSECESAASERGFEPQRRARALVEALPYIRKFRGSVVVIKYGGRVMADPELAESFAREVVLISSVGLRPVVVHGGGPQISRMLARIGKRSEFRDGMRVTDAATLEVARMVLVGRIGRDIVSAINVSGGTAAGVSGEDGHLITAVPRDPRLGYVGDVASVDPRIIGLFLDAEIVPVVSSIGADSRGQAYNINADVVAAALAGALGASKVVYLTDVAGLLADVDDPSSVLPEVTVGEVAAMIDSGRITGGMIPKARACSDALRMGAGSAHMLDGRVPNAVLLELFTDAGIGTMITVGGTGAADVGGGAAATVSGMPRTDGPPGGAADVCAAAGGAGDEEDEGGVL